MYRANLCNFYMSSIIILEASKCSEEGDVLIAVDLSVDLPVVYISANLPDFQVDENRSRRRCLCIVRIVLENQRQAWVQTEPFLVTEVLTGLACFVLP